MNPQESCHKMKTSPLLQKSKEYIEEDQFWDVLEVFCLTLDAKLVSFVE